MTQAVLNFMKIGENSIVASNRIAKYIAQKTGAVLIDQKKAVTGEMYDRLYIVNGPGLYCDYLRDMENMVDAAKEVIWVGNDYAIKLPGFVKNHPNLWHFSAYENIYQSERHQLVNWNALTFEKEIPERIIKFPGLTYYGAYREDRQKYFDKYLGEPSAGLYKVHISSSKNGIVKFRGRYGAFNEWSGENLLSRLGYFQSTIYIEDEKSHKIYCSPANRFYEALSTRTLILFDKSCKPTFDRAKIDIDPWIVDGAVDYARKLDNFAAVRQAQIDTLRATDYTKILDTEFLEASRLLR